MSRGTVAKKRMQQEPFCWWMWSAPWVVLERVRNQVTYVSEARRMGGKECTLRWKSGCEMTTKRNVLPQRKRPARGKDCWIGCGRTCVRDEFDLASSIQTPDGFLSCLGHLGQGRRLEYRKWIRKSGCEQDSRRVCGSTQRRLFAMDNSTLTLTESTTLAGSFKIITIGSRTCLLFADAKKKNIFEGVRTMIPTCRALCDRRCLWSSWTGSKIGSQRTTWISDGVTLVTRLNESSQDGSSQSVFVQPYWWMNNVKVLLTSRSQHAQYWKVWAKGVWDPEKEMNDWELGGRLDLLPEKEDDGQDIESRVLLRHTS